MSVLRQRRSDQSSTSDVRSLLSKDLHECKAECSFAQELFRSCVSDALRQERVSDAHTYSLMGKESKCFKVFKIVWIVLLCFLAFCLIAVGFKPVAFHFHKLIHDRLYYILRPVRLAMVSILPLLDKMNLDFLNTDCMLENPLLSEAEQCACFGIKYPQEIDLEFSALPLCFTKPGIHDVYILSNTTQYNKDMNIMDFVEFPLKFGGYPLSCHQISGENVEIFYDEFFQKDKVVKALTREGWSLSWEECPDTTNSLTLHQIIPPLQPPLHLTANATFTLTTKWGGFSHFMESFPNGAVVVVRILLGEARFVMEPKKEECMATCSMFRKNPVLRQGDALLFDQRVWTFFATSWTDVTFITVQLASFA